MNVIVVGCGRVGSELAYGLFKDGHKVVVLDQDAAAFRNLPPDFRGRTLQGDVLSRELLVRAGIQECDALAAVTPVDSVNAVVAHVAKVAFNVKNVVVRDYDPAMRALHEAFGHQLVSPSVWGAQRIQELLSEDTVRAVFTAGNGEVEVYEFTVPAAWTGRQLADLTTNGTSQTVAVTRSGRAMLPSPELVVEAGDLILIGATEVGIADLRRRVSNA